MYAFKNLCLCFKGNIFFNKIFSGNKVFLNKYFILTVSKKKVNRKSPTLSFRISRETWKKFHLIFTAFDTDICANKTIKLFLAQLWFSIWTERLDYCFNGYWGRRNIFSSNEFKYELLFNLKINHISKQWCLWLFNSSIKLSDPTWIMKAWNTLKITNNAVFCCHPHSPESKRK